jgi:tetratricopeptide (TPR) repeat protein
LTINKSTAFLKGVPMQDFNADIIRCTTAIELNPKDVSAYLARGRAHRFQGENQEAIDDYSKAIELSPKDSSGYTNREQVYRSMGKIKEADADFAKAKQLQVKR